MILPGQRLISATARIYALGSGSTQNAQRRVINASAIIARIASSREHRC